MDLSIIIPAANDPQGLTKTLESLCADNEVPQEKRIEIIVVNDGGHRQISQICSSYQVKEVPVVPNAGSYSARNCGVEESQGQLLGFIDCGVTVVPGWKHRALKAAELGEYVGGGVTFPLPGLSNPLHAYHFGCELAAEHTFSVSGYVMTANLVTTRELFDRMGGFDSRLRSGGDYEFGVRVGAVQNYKMSIDLKRIVVHEYRTLAQLIKKQFRTTMGTRRLSELFPESFGSKRPSVKNFLKGLLPPVRVQKEAWRARRFTLSARLGAIAIGYLLKLSKSFALCLPEKNPDSFEWAAGNNNTGD